MADNPDFHRGAKVNRWAANLENPTKALKQIGAIIVAESQEAFDEQSHGGESWEPRNVPNVFGIISDFSKESSSAPPARRFEESPVLTDTGALKSSIAEGVSIHGKTVTVGSALEYADVMHGGGEIESEPVTESVQESLSKWLAKDGEEWTESLAFLLKDDMAGETLKGSVVARPIVDITDQTLEDIQEMVGVTLLEVE